MPWVPWLCLTGVGLCSHLSRLLDRAWARLSVPQLRPLLASPSWQNSDDYRDLGLHLTQLCANNWEQRRFLSHFYLISDHSAWDFIGAQWMFMEMKLHWQWHLVPPFPNTGWAWLCTVSVTQELALSNCLSLDAAMCSERNGWMWGWGRGSCVSAPVLTTAFPSSIPPIPPQWVALVPADRCPLSLLAFLPSLSQPGVHQTPPCRLGPRSPLSEILFTSLSSFLGYPR